MVGIWVAMNALLFWLAFSAQSSTLLTIDQALYNIDELHILTDNKAEQLYNQICCHYGIIPNPNAVVVCTSVAGTVSQIQATRSTVNLHTKKTQESLLLYSRPATHFSSILGSRCDPCTHSAASGSEARWARTWTPKGSSQSKCQRLAIVTPRDLGVHVTAHRCQTRVD